MDRFLRRSGKIKSSDFVKKHCRLCPNIYCCESCRKKHEIRVHKIRPDCDICVYGSLIALDDNTDLVNHLKETHWPLHCVLCNKVFDTLEEIYRHRLCPARIKNSPLSVQKLKPAIMEKMYSPYSGAEMPSNTQQYVTSTPMQNTIESNFRIKITPVEHQSKSNDNNVDPEALTKRRVTFSKTSTPAIEHKESKMKDSPSESVFYSIKEDVCVIDNEKHSDALVPSLPESQDSECEDCPKLELSKDTVISEDNTLWTSALNDSEYLEIENKELFVPKTATKPVNAWPTPVLTREDYKINFQICKKIFSTPVAIREKERKVQKLEPFIHEEKTEGQFFLRKEGIHLPKKTDPVGEDANNTGTNLWTSMTNIVKNVIHGLANTSNNSLKRSYSDDDLDSHSTPPIKRLKFTDIKCRPPIRDLPAIEFRAPSLTFEHTNYNKPKIYVDKATQTDFE